MTRRYQLGCLCAGLCSLLATLAWIPGSNAQEKTPLSSHLAVFRVVTGTDGDESHVAVSSAHPGDILEYRLTLTNNETGPIGNLTPRLPIPDAMSYLPDSARPHPVQASLDGSQFEAVPLMHEVTRADGSVITEPVPASDYRFLRWRIPTLAPGETVTVSMRVQVRDD